ncbi:O-antigen ligase family protein [Trichlorobacter lovleyi]|uniref:O-antigen ligase-related domain-containing protein n=1 Tax=Trichlorobacter lovleyi (strain ATCC BAA-1151 / DSM 17278 / SZ) TaxID=398767 RepID=B3E8U5_TRIL1|nr:O-antigen ligase family protein [Trichlorobacter lovleyi]ACD95213.1 hypothetical protein Glov_1495 [Trichlorobacter lovleyi SZ]
MTTSDLYKYSTFTILFMLLLTPTFYAPGVIGIRLEEIYVLLFVLIIFCIPNKNGWSIKIPSRVIIMLFFPPILMLSIFAGAVCALPATLADLMKLVWLAKSILIYIIFYNFINLDGSGLNNRIEFIIRSYISLAAVSSLVCFQQYFNLFNLNSIYIPLIAPTQFTSLMPGYPTPRVVGMMGNPNIQGYALAIGILLAIYMTLNKKETAITITLPVMFIALFMTLSRGALISLFAGLFLFLFAMKNTSTKIKLIKIAIGLIIIFTLYYSYEFLLQNELLYNAILYRYENLDNVAEDTSFSARYGGWSINWKYFNMSPILGVGFMPRATNIFIGADNEWIYILRSLGLLGVVWLLILLIAPFIFNKKSKQIAKNINTLVLSIILLACVFMIPAAVIFSPLTFPFLLIFMSFSDSTIYLFKHRNSNDFIINS